MSLKAAMLYGPLCSLSGGNRGNTGNSLSSRCPVCMKVLRPTELAGVYNPQLFECPCLPYA